MAKVSKETLAALQAQMPKNVNETMARYCALMQEAKDRLGAVNFVLGGQKPSPVLHPRVANELAYLQLRMVCELIALASVMAHGELGVALDSKIRKEDRPGVLLKLLEKLHPESYPRPFRFILNSAGEVVSVQDITTGFLTRDELPKLYGLCGNELHQGDLSKIGLFPPTEKSAKDILTWCGKVFGLLNSHKIKLYNSSSEILVFMEHETTKQVFWQIFATVSASDVILARRTQGIHIRRSVLPKSARPLGQKASKRGRRRQKPS
jgi:hypothetical protein